MNAGMVLQILLNKNHKIFAKLKKSHNLAKVGVAGSSPVFRSNAIPRIIYVRMAELVDALL